MVSTTIGLDLGKRSWEYRPAPFWKQTDGPHILSVWGPSFMATPVEIARHYLKNGFSVIPVDGSTKRPLLKSWSDYQKRLPTDEEITSWWTDWPAAGFAVVTGAVSGVTVVDIEKGAIPVRGLDIETPLVRTGGGGYHYYFKYAPGFPNSIRFAELHDLKNDGGYVIAPPTVHKSGRKYEWEIPYGSVELVELPTEIVNLTQKKGKRVSEILNTLTQAGSRNPSAASVAGKLLSRLPER